MSSASITYPNALRIGSIDFVASDGFGAVLDVAEDDGFAQSTGTVGPFPRINGYVLIPSAEGYWVAQVASLSLERLGFMRRKGDQDLPSVRKMQLNPLGYLVQHGISKVEKESYRFRRGVESYPALGDPVLLPTQVQLHAIVESGAQRRVLIGTSPVAANSEVRVDPDSLFGQHLAILGSAGSGKSCSVVALVRGSLEAARKARKGAAPNARFIVFDLKGEYAKAFSDIDKLRVFGAEPLASVEQLEVPLWLWNSAELGAFCQAREGAQQAILRRALRKVKSEAALPLDAFEEEKLALRQKLSAIFVELQGVIRKSSQNLEPTDLGFMLLGQLKALNQIKSSFNAYAEPFVAVISAFNAVIRTRIVDASAQSDGSNAFTVQDIARISDAVKVLLDELGGFVYQEGSEEDRPQPFKASDLVEQLESLAKEAQAGDLVDGIVTRMRGLLADRRMSAVAGDAEDLTLDDWLTDCIGVSASSSGSITVIDLSLVPVELVPIVVAVISRMTHEALERYRRCNAGKFLPTVLVVEEADLFMKPINGDGALQHPVDICSQVFEKIAHEGSQSGLALVLSSARPSALSAAVLSQCQSFLLHRVSNDGEQAVVEKMAPDGLRGLLGDLPTLPPCNAILLGRAVDLPILVQMTALLERHQPQSSKVGFWAAWSGRR